MTGSIETRLDPLFNHWPNIMSFLGLENLHVFVTGAAGGIGSQAVTQFLSEDKDIGSATMYSS